MQIADAGHVLILLTGRLRFCSTLAFGAADFMSMTASMSRVTHGQAFIVGDGENKSFYSP